MSQRSKILADRFQGVKATQAISTEASLQRSKILDQGFVQISAEVRDALRAQCEELNAEPQIGNILVCDLSGENSQITRTDTGTVLHITFDELRHAITFKCGKPAKFSYTLQVMPTENEMSYWYADAKGNALGGIRTAEIVADTAVCALLGVER